MKKVIINPVPNSKTVVVNNVDHLISKHNYVGFEESNGGERYFIVTGGSARGFAVNPLGTFAMKNEQMETYTEGYFVFETAEELYNWILEEELNDD